MVGCVKNGQVPLIVSIQLAKPATEPFYNKLWYSESDTSNSYWIPRFVRLSWLYLNSDTIILCQWTRIYKHTSGVCFPICLMLCNMCFHKYLCNWNHGRCCTSRSKFGFVFMHALFHTRVKQGICRTLCSTCLWSGVSLWTAEMSVCPACFIETWNTAATEMQVFR